MTQIRMLIGICFAWLASVILPRGLGDFSRVTMQTLIGLYGEMQRGRTFGVVTIAWGEKEPAERMQNGAADALATERSKIECERNAA